MPTDDLDYLRDLFEPVGGVVFRRMFGGLGIYRDGLMFGLVSDETIYLKVDDETRSAFEVEGSAAFAYHGKDGRRMTMAYWRLPGRLLDEPDELRDWALAAIAVSVRALQAKSRKPAKSRSRA